jgi:hypothetical protein
MTARTLEAAAWTVALAGADGESVAAAFDPAWGARLAVAVAALRPAGARERRARVLAAAGLRLLRAPAAPPAASDALGARFVAAWLRALDPADRAAFVRALGAAPADALRRALASAPTLDAARRSTATHLVGLTHRALGRAPALAEWSALLSALALRSSLDDAALLRAARVVRLSPRAPSCLALAAELCGP